MKVLLYNLENNIVLKTTLNMMNIQCVYVDNNDYNKPLSTLLGLDNKEVNDSCINFSDEMMIMYDFDDQQLDALLSLLKMNGIVIPLKAIVTETNINWNGIQIRNELIKEHSYMQKKKNS